MPSSDVGAVLVLTTQAVFVGAVLAVWVHHVRALWAFRQAHDGLHRFRLVSVVQGISFIAFAFWRMLVWAGVLFDDPYLYSHPDDRWPIDLLFWVLLALSALIVAHLYYDTRSGADDDDG